jgi:uncharacterized membrane protein
LSTYKVEKPEHGCSESTLRIVVVSALVSILTVGLLLFVAAALLTHRPSLRLQGLLLRDAVTGVLIGAVTGAFVPALLGDTIILRYSIVGSVVGGLARLQQH